MKLKRLLAIAAASLIWIEAPAQSVPMGNYTIDAEASEVHWLVYRTGPLARFGHNHVISAGRMSGSVSVAGSWAESSFEIEMPVAELVVDDASLRAQQGEDFASEPSEEDIAGTRRNMLSESLLDAEQYPVLRIRGEEPGGTPAEGNIRLTLDVAGGESTVMAPVSVESDGEVLTATGSFKLTHEQLGLEPFSALGGALRVAQEMDFSYSIVARQSPDSGEPEGR